MPPLLLRPIKKAHLPFLVLEREELVAAEVQLGVAPHDGHEEEAPLVLRRKHEELDLVVLYDVHLVLRQALGVLFILFHDFLVCLLPVLLLPVVVGIAVLEDAVPVLEHQLEVRDVPVPGQVPAGLLAVEAVDEHHLAAVVGHAADGVGYGGHGVAQVHVGKAELLGIDILDGAPDAGKLELRDAAFAVVPGLLLKLDALSGHELLERLAEDVNAAGLPRKLYHGIGVERPVGIKFQQELVDDAVDVRLQQELDFLDVEHHVGKGVVVYQLPVLPHHEVPAVYARDAQVLVLLVVIRLEAVPDNPLARIELLLHLVRYLEQEIEVVLDHVVVVPRVVFVPLEARGDDFLRRVVCLVEPVIDLVLPELVHIAEDVLARDGDEVVDVHHFLPAVVVGKHDLDVLHDAVRDVVAAEVCVAVLVGCLDVDAVCDAVIADGELARAQVGRAAAAVDNQRGIECAVLVALLFYQAVDGVVDYRRPLVKHVHRVNLILGQQIREHPVKLLLELHGACEVELPETALESLLGTPDDVQEVLPDDGSPDDLGDMPLLVRDLLHLFVAPHPPFHLVKDAERLVVVFHAGILFRLVAEVVYDVVPVAAVCHARDGREHRHPFFLAFLIIQKIDLIDGVKLHTVV